ncbi:glycosyltransferase [Rheinheimera soli]|uniref:glycosyltransferase n=1 Tax=Rheinheimera soli TaxID=443616 RepID=UPI001E612264|nr:glycosyltransferase [Rheinheimera soli]
MNVLFLGGVFTDSLVRQVLVDTLSPVQNAADNLQKNYIQGLKESQRVENVTVINLPFVGSYPFLYKKMLFTADLKVESLKGVKVVNLSFFNFLFLKNFFRIYKSLTAILAEVKKNREQKNYLFCYSMHLPFLIACYMAKLINPSITVCIIVPDLPEFMAARKGFSAFVFGIFSKISYAIVNRADLCVLLTEHMKNSFSDELPSVVIDGIADERFISQIEEHDTLNYFLYTGTLDSRYGIRDLIQSYIDSGVVDHELHICGDGSEREYVERVAADFPNIKYFGQMPREQALAKQHKAKLLVNPRNNNSEYTKYSFPSKVIEYMSSGVPVLMYKLDGISTEYYEFVYTIPNVDGGMASCFSYIALLESSELKKKGADAKQFILNNKMPLQQVEKILHYLA